MPASAGLAHLARPILSLARTPTGIQSRRTGFLYRRLHFRPTNYLQLGCTYRLYLPKRYHRLQFFGMQIVGRISADPPKADGA
jgi:hypothetical protein